MLSIVTSVTYVPTFKTSFNASYQWHRHCFHCTTTRDEKRSRRTIQPNAHNGLGGFSAWPAQARAFSKWRSRTHHLRPTECPNGSCDLFRLGSPSQGILGLKKDRRSKAGILANQVASNRMPKWLERPFPPGVAEPGHFSFARVFTRVEGDADQQSLEPEGCPNGLGGFSAFNPPRPGRLKRVEGSGFRV